MTILDLAKFQQKTLTPQANQNAVRIIDIADRRRDDQLRREWDRMGVKV